MPTVSIIVPVYKVESYLPRCIDSILAQTYTDFELILVDDGSPDHSGNICDEYAAKDNRIRVIHKENGGVSSARNAGLDLAFGKYILFVDSDDYISSDFIQQLTETECDLSLCGFVCKNETGQILFQVVYEDAFFEEKTRIPYAALYKKNMLYSPYCKLFRSDIIHEQGIRFPVDINWGEDGMFVADYLAHVNRLRTLKYSGYHYIRYTTATRLSTRVRADIIDMVVRSREYCITQMAKTAPWAYYEISAICSEDICRNCADFVILLFCSTAMSWAQKISLLTKFFLNPYVVHTRSHLDHYYGKHGKICIAMAQKQAKECINCYRRITSYERFHRWVYQNMYLPLPECVKHFYRKIKGAF